MYLFAAFCKLNSTYIRRVSSTSHMASLQMKAGLTLMTNLGLFSNLITIPVPTQWCGFGFVLWEQNFF